MGQLETRGTGSALGLSLVSPHHQTQRHFSTLALWAGVDCKSECLSSCLWTCYNPRYPVVSYNLQYPRL